MIKVIITDLDGTLFYGHGDTSFDLTKRNEESLALLKEKDIHLYIASGRAPIYTHAILDKYGFNDHKIAAFNGSIMEDNDKRINTFLLSNDSIKEIYDYLLEDIDNIQCIQLMSVDAQRIFHDKNCSDVDKYKKTMDTLKMGSISDIEIKDYLALKMQLEIPKVMLNLENEEKTIALYKKLNEHFKGKYFVAQSFDTFIEVCDLRASKGHLVNYLISEYGYKADEISVIGDSLNDLGMYIEGTHKFAMQSGSNFLKEKADYIVTDFAECVDISINQLSSSS